MSQDIKIKAQPAADRSRCEFSVDRPVFPEGAALFRDRESASGSPLAERLLALPEVTAVYIAGPTVVVHRDPAAAEDWLPLARTVGASIREVLASGSRAVDPAVLSRGGEESSLRAAVQELLDREINPMVASHGGHIDVVDVRGQDLWLRMGGGCQGCGSATATLRAGVERLLRERLPTLGVIHDATDHAAGENPYYAH